jgi:hypothetical protein
MHEDFCGKHVVEAPRILGDHFLVVLSWQVVNEDLQPPHRVIFQNITGTPCSFAVVGSVRTGYALTDAQELTAFTNQTTQSPTPRLEDRTVEHRTKKSTTPTMVTNSNTHMKKKSRFPNPNR